MPKSGDRYTGTGVCRIFLGEGNDTLAALAHIYRCVLASGRSFGIGFMGFKLMLSAFFIINDIKRRHQPAIGEMVGATIGIGQPPGLPLRVHR